MTDKEVFSKDDFDEIINECSELVTELYSEKMEMRDISLLGWFMAIFERAIAVKYDEKIKELKE